MSNDQLIPATQFCFHYQVEISFLHSLRELGLLELTQVQEEEFIVPEQLCHLEKMIRLHYELDINPEGIDAITHMTHRIEALQQELNVLKNRLRLYEREG